MQITILGSGRWATFLAWYVNRTGHDTLLWGRRGSQSLAALQKDRQNAYVTLP